MADSNTANSNSNSKENLIELDERSVSKPIENGKTSIAGQPATPPEEQDKNLKKTSVDKPIDAQSSNTPKDSAALKNDGEKLEAEKKTQTIDPANAVNEKDKSKVQELRKAEERGDEGKDTSDKNKRLTPTSDLENRYAISQDKNATVYANKHRQDVALVTDKGGSITANRTDPEAIQLTVQIAKEKHWEQIKVKGSEDFRRKMWHEASKEGIEVKGYTPSRDEQEAMTKYLSANRNIENTVAPIIEHSKKAATAMPELKTAEDRRRFVSAVEKNASEVLKKTGVPALNERAKGEMEKSKQRDSTELSR